MKAGISDGHPFVRYAISAVVSVVANLVAQQFTVVGMPAAPLMASIIVGTIVGFIVKYVIDKTWTFREAYTTHKGEARRITLSGLFSVLTTLIFWAFELGFYAVWQTDFAKYTGAVVGLSIGYIIKFWLDRRHVFREATV
ncbi:putative flippase GtrA [Yoonia maricola]|uniref:Putative flippase GtrA n=1 Tax=Yoonia maricola TaxID=420999 RepID=A0A2M8WKM8_9RHOB|nr:GtrA family protein [Yoonia maricola]PJI91468.1 putative flippase GtrA [Yoonia maricola]